MNEQETVYIYQQLTKAGYLIQQNHGMWHIIEPRTRKLPQEKRGIPSLKACQLWADGIETGRHIMELNSAT